MKFASYFVLFLFVGLFVLQFVSCKHSPIVGDDPFPIDTTDNPVDTMELDPCDPDIVYFDLQILPILNSNCAFSGCHDAATAQNGVILESFESVIATADVEPFDLDGSKLYKVLVEDDPEKRMPFELPPLKPNEIQIIAKWILQGALDLECDPDAGECNTENISYSQDVAPVLQSHCLGCHSGASPPSGLDLSTHANVKAVTPDDRLFNAIAWVGLAPQMPQGGQQLPECTIDQIKSWIDAGAPDN